MHTEATKKGFIKGELLRYATHSATKKDYLTIRTLFFHRLNIRGYPKTFLQKEFKKVTYENRKDILYRDEKLNPKKSNNNAIFLLQWDQLAKYLNLNKFFKNNWTYEMSEETNTTPFVSYRTGLNIKRKIQKTNGRNS